MPVRQNHSLSHCSILRGSPKAGAGKNQELQDKARSVLWLDGKSKGRQGRAKGDSAHQVLLEMGSGGVSTPGSTAGLWPGCPRAQILQPELLPLLQQRPEEDPEHPLPCSSTETRKVWVPKGGTLRSVRAGAKIPKSNFQGQTTFSVCLLGETLALSLVLEALEL